MGGAWDGGRSGFSAWRVAATAADAEVALKQEQSSERGWGGHGGMRGHRGVVGGGRVEVLNGTKKVVVANPMEIVTTTAALGQRCNDFTTYQLSDAIHSINIDNNITINE